MNVYEQIFNIVDPVLKFYRDDLLVHDKDSLKDFNKESCGFIYNYSESHTHISLFQPIDVFTSHKQVDQHINWIKAKLNTFKDDNWLYWNNAKKKLVKIPFNQAALYADTYINNISNQAYSKFRVPS